MWTQDNGEGEEQGVWPDSRASVSLGIGWNQEWMLLADSNFTQSLLQPWTGKITEKSKQ